MGFTRHYFDDLNFVLTKITGAINDNDLAMHVDALNKESKGKTNLKELADCRAITKINLTSQGTAINASNEKPKPGSILAILVPKDDEMIFAMARAYQMFSEDYRKSVYIFRDYHNALNWLSNDCLEEANALDTFISSA